MSEPGICQKCPTKSCLKSKVDSVDVCKWGIAYYRKGEGFTKNETLVPLRYLPENLRHEINRVLALITKEVNLIDPELSSKSIDLKKPTNRIHAATIIVDHFLQMIAGVHDFHPSTSMRGNIKANVSLSNLIQKYYDIFSLIRNPRRTQDLQLNMINCNLVKISFAPDCLEYIIACLIDNMWKYSFNSSKADVQAVGRTGGLIDIVFRNKSHPIPEGTSIFEKGVQANIESDGFGYGLFWATILMTFYNELRGDTESPAELIHSQKVIDAETALQEFTLKGIVGEMRGREQRL